MAKILFKHFFNNKLEDIYISQAKSLGSIIPFVLVAPQLPPKLNGRDTDLSFLDPFRNA